MDPDPMAQRRADLIIQERSGKITAVEAARQLGVSRKTFYKWEGRALEAMVQAVSDREGGRPAQERDEEKALLRARIAELEAELRERDQAERTHEVLAQAEKKRTMNERKF